MNKKYIKKLIKKSKKNIKGYNQSFDQKLWELKNANKPKIFGIGNNKTGTTSLKVAMQNLGFKVGAQRPAELLLHEYAVRNFKPLIELCKTAEFFQDFPFSKPFTYIALDQAFPGSKFILTVRDTPEQWYNSVTKFHSKLWGKDGNLPTKEDLMEAPYIYKGWAWDLNRILSIVPENDLYNKELMIKSYLEYNQDVIKYFRHRPQDLLVLNVSERGAFQKLCEFVGVDSDDEEFPWENKTATIKTK